MKNNLVATAAVALIALTGLEAEAQQAGTSAVPAGRLSLFGIELHSDIGSYETENIPPEWGGNDVPPYQNAHIEPPRRNRSLTAYTVQYHLDTRRVEFIAGYQEFSELSLCEAAAAAIAPQLQQRFSVRLDRASWIDGASSISGYSFISSQFYVMVNCANTGTDLFLEVVLGSSAFAEAVDRASAF